ncbi:MAG: Na/Pi cotransporter family protein [Chitinophagales bacterium]
MGLDYWKILGGIGIFLFGIQLLENSLKNLMSRRFKLFLKKQTSNPIKGIFGGTVVTAVLQSSSAVNFMVLAFVSTGIITMRNAFAVIMGANLGTTLDSWIVASLGFKVDIEAFAYPVAGIAGLVLFIFENKNKVVPICHFLLGFSFLFIGLGLMKDSVEGEAIKNLFNTYADASLFVFFLVGLVVTSITQSSSATIAITLSILHQELIGFESAIAIVIGSEIGTSIKLILGSLNGVAVKKRVAVGNFIYNVVTSIIVFILIHPIALFIQNGLSLKDPLIGLVTFQTGMNVLSIIIFLPLINQFSHILEKFFKNSEKHVSLYLQNSTAAVPEAAVEILEKETRFFISQSRLFNLLAFEIEKENIAQPEKYDAANLENNFYEISPISRYEMIKEHYGEIQSYYIKIKTERLNEKIILQTDKLIASVRSAMYAAKCIKDLFNDMHELKNSSQEIKYDYYNQMKKEVTAFYKLTELEENSSMDEIFNKLVKLLEGIQKIFNENLNKIYSSEYVKSLSDVDIATLMNFNREITTSHKSVIMSLKNLLLDDEGAERFSEIPTYQA